MHLKHALELMLKELVLSASVLSLTFVLTCGAKWSVRVKKKKKKMEPWTGHRIKESTTETLFRMNPSERMLAFQGCRWPYRHPRCKEL